MLSFTVRSSRVSQAPTGDEQRQWHWTAETGYDIVPGVSSVTSGGSWREQQVDASQQPPGLGLSATVVGWPEQQHPPAGVEGEAPNAIGLRRWAIEISTATSTRLPPPPAGGPGPRVPSYPVRFKALVTFVLVFSWLWILHYTWVVSPTLDSARHADCEYSNNQLAHSARMLFLYFLWFLASRIALFIPCVILRVVRVQIHTHGCCQAYCVHLMLRDGPLYVFVLGTLLFWLHLMQSPICNEEDPRFRRTLKVYAIYSSFMSMFCLILAHWHNRILEQEWVEEQEGGHVVHRAAPPDTMAKLATQQHDEALFGDEEGKLYPAECAICLSAWEHDDVIKVTPCGHVFHEECLGGWLRTARTCALCRSDLTAAATTSAPSPLPAQPFSLLASGVGPLSAASPSQVVPSDDRDVGTPVSTPTSHRTPSTPTSRGHVEATVFEL